jgi:tetratricopeptide (TPR) repeat protein
MTRRKRIDDAPHQPTSAISSPAPETCFAQRPWFLALVLVIATVAAYQPAWQAGFIWDDDAHLTANPAVASPNGLQMIWSSLAVSRYYPLTLTTFWIEHRVWSLNPLPYHLVNVALHAANGVLIFFLLRRLRIPAAWLAAMLWALHPVNVESVAWVTEMKNTQSGLFFFLALLCFLRFETDSKPRWYALAIACGLAALTSKPSTVVLPLVLLLCVWWERGSWKRADILRVAPFFMLALGMSALTVVEQQRHIQVTGTAEWNLGMAARFVLAGKTVWFYAWKTLWPARLTFVYPHWELDPRSLWNWLPLGGLVIGGVLLWHWRRQSWARAGLFGCGFFVLALLPVLGFFDVYYFRFSYVADHFQYLADLGLIALAASAGTAIATRAGPWGRPWGTLVAALVLLVLGSATWSQAHVYHDMKTLWRDTLAKNPGCWMAHNNLGAAYSLEGNTRDAIGEYQEALRLKPDYADAHNNFGFALAQAGDIPEAVAHYQQALRIMPHHPEAHNNLATVLVQQGKLPDAIEHYQQALLIKSDSAELHWNLANTLMQAGNLQEAIAHYQQALRISPDYAVAHGNLGVALEEAGRVPEAIEHFEQALRISPDYAAAHYNLGNLLSKQGKLSDGIVHYEQALRIRPNYAEAHYNLGVALEEAGRVPEAVAHYQQALRLKPGFVEAQTALARLQAR